MSEEEKIFSVTHFWEDETRAYYEGKPFTGVCVDYYQNGKKNMRKCVKVDIKDGLWASWRDDGFNNNRVHCTYDLRLQIKQRGSFVNGFK